MPKPTELSEHITETSAYHQASVCFHSPAYYTHQSHTLHITTVNRNITHHSWQWVHTVSEQSTV